MKWPNELLRLRLEIKLAEILENVQNMYGRAHVDAGLIRACGGLYYYIIFPRKPTPVSRLPTNYSGNKVLS